MKKIDVDTFALSLKEDIDNFVSFQNDYSNEQLTPDEWMHRFNSFSGYSDIEDDESFEDYEDEEEFYYGTDLQYEDVVNRRKYRSFRDDDSY